jgi:capping protein alpha
MDVSDAEIVEIVTQFLLSSPPGEFMEVVTDVRGLLGSRESLLNDSAPATFRRYNTSQFLHVVSPGNDHKVVICEEGEVGDGEYLDPRGGQVVQFDHIRQEVTGSRPISGELDSSVEGSRKAFDDAISKYAYDYYQNGACTVYGKSEGGQHVITAVISSARYNPDNFWNGSWRSTWVCSFKPGGGPVQLTGNIKINVHYYEDGNVQLNVNTPVTLTAKGSDPAAAAAQAIAKTDNQYQNKLKAMYDTMGDTTFKALRRALPITRQRLDWDKIQNYKISGSIGGGRRK